MTKLLALHGYHGSGEQLRAQMEPLFGGGLGMEIIAPDAPSLAEHDHGWWHADDNKRYQGWTRTRAFVEELFAKHAFDAVFGFSQGAVLASLVVGILPVRFAMMVGGFPSRDPRHAEIYANAERYAIPSLHMIGLRDTVVPPSASQLLADKFKKPTIVEHDGGHEISAKPRDEVMQFVISAGLM